MLQISLSWRIIAFFAICIAFISTAYTAPVSTPKSKPTPAPTPKPKAPSTALTLAQLQKAMDGKCPKATVGDAITCKDALPYINAAMKKYKLKTKGQRAAYLANMFFEGGYLQFNHNLVVSAQGTRSIMPAMSLRIFVDANLSVQKLWPGFPASVVNDKIVDVLIKNKLDFEPGAWWVLSGPSCAETAAKLSGSQASFTAWETACINGGTETVAARATIYKTVYAAI
ncbi:hypothetical protein CPC16_002680 [Podila verticillata]|nr:hypothetical protein CPC16_002680 [Podila verticillata]KFH73687.1 hypothetical protein MVEG_00901 [Podila verticillata NRRL 6337]